jgi:hypothetical protein
MAALGMVVWAAGGWWLAQHPTPVLQDLLGCLLVALWLRPLAQFLRWQGHASLLHRAVGWVAPALLAVAALWSLLAAPGLVRPAPTPVSIAICLIAFCTVGLYAVEQLFRNAPAALREPLRWLCLGIGGLLLGELIVRAQQVALGTVATGLGSWRAPWSVACAGAILLGGAVQRLRQRAHVL